MIGCNVEQWDKAETMGKQDEISESSGKKRGKSGENDRSRGGRTVTMGRQGRI
jgi:hypothetical protein